MNRFWMLTVTIVAGAASAFGQSTAFTYQGRLDDGDVPASGLHDLRFRLFDAASGGAQIGATQCADNVSVANGLFSLQLDFGQQFATAAARFLEIDVRDDAGLNCSNASGFVTLSPRQRLTATPLASHARSAFALDAADGSPANAAFVDNDGDVGIGTLSPLAKLHVDSGDLYMGLPTNGWFMHTRAPFGGDFLHLTDTVGGVPQFQRGLALTKSGNLVIGASTPLAKLHVDSGDLYIGLPTNGWFMHTRASFGGDFLHLTDTVGGVPQFQRGLSLTKSGRVGIGTTGPANLLHVRGAAPAMILQDTASTANQAGYIGFWNNAPSETAWVGFGTVGNPDFTVFNGRSGGDIRLQPGPGGVVSVPILEVTGADLAERFPASESLAPGMVAAIDPSNPGKLCLARGAYNRCVAGVVSGANDFAAGAILGNLPGDKDAPAIALSGRVYVWCDASDAPIEAGDLLTTSDSPGHAMKAVDPARTGNSVLGKAMSQLAKGERGLVLVLVNLQ